MPLLPSLQILRFLAAFAVVLFHVGSGLAQEYPALHNRFAFGSAGVDVFFVLSGFIMAYATDPARGSLHFALRRIARIVPIYWVLTLALAVVAALLPQLLNSTQVSAGAVLKSLLFIPYEKPNGLVQPLLFLGWTLCYEIFFYVIYCAALNTGRYTIATASAGLLGCVAVGLIVPSTAPLWEFYTAPILLEFIFGMALFLVYARIKPQPSYLIAAALLGLSALLAVALEGQERFLSAGVPSAAIVAAFLCLPCGRGPVTGLLVLLGNASYSLYLVHPYVLQLPIKLLGDRGGVAVAMGAAALAALASILVSIALLYLIEKPAQRAILKRFAHMTDRPRGPQGAGTPN